jgi:hypothetical protein
MKRLMIAAVAALLASPALAQSPAPAPGTGDIQTHRPGSAHFNKRAPSRSSADPLSAFAAVTPFGSPVAEPSGGREASIRQCNTEAAKTYAVRDSNWSLFVYRACMAQHSQAE